MKGLITKHYLNNQRGSFAAMAFVFMLFLGIALAGVMPMMIAELGHAQIQRNAVEAQFAAEAGLKRIVAAFASYDS